MRNSNVWVILSIIALAVGLMFFRNFSQNQLIFDDFDEFYDVNYLEKKEESIVEASISVPDNISEPTKTSEAKTSTSKVVSQNKNETKSPTTNSSSASTIEKNYTCGNSGDLDCLVSKRVSEIRNTRNTDISKRTGNIYYVSADGNDANDGLSSSTPFKTMSKISSMFSKGLIPAGSTILFRDGDLFRGSQITVRVDNILIGSYGDISKGKPTFTRSLYDGAREGTWIEVKPNIWKYQVDDKDSLFTTDVGVIWFFCNSGNNCNNSLNTLEKKYTYAKKITTNISYDDTNIESKIDTLLKNDLEFYHTGHANASNNAQKGGAIYLYSKGNPKNRFSEIEFATGGGIFFKGPSGYVDNIRIRFIGNHGINANTLSNLVVTNSELGFIGGATQSYNSDGNPIRYGNAIEIYGSVMDVNGTKVTDGFVLKNNYVYEVYDAGLTFQFSTSGVAHMEKANFINNVLENYNYGVEYWMYTSSSNESVVNQSYINNFDIQNNIFRNAGKGVSQTRLDKGCSAHIKTWNRDYTYNIVKGEFEIKNNIFGYAAEQYVYLKSSYYSNLPTISGNTFYGKSSYAFGYYFAEAEKNKKKLYFDDTVLNTYFPGNTYVILDKK